jgi:hypothetical protein
MNLNRTTAAGSANRVHLCVNSHNDSFARCLIVCNGAFFVHIEA